MKTSRGSGNMSSQVPALSKRSNFNRQSADMKSYSLSNDTRINRNNQSDQVESLEKEVDESGSQSLEKEEIGINNNDMVATEEYGSEKTLKIGEKFVEWKESSEATGKTPRRELVFNPYTARFIEKNERERQKKNWIFKARDIKQIAKRNELSSDDKSWFGSRMPQRTKSFRLYLQNPNGVDVSDSTLLFRLLMDDVRRHNISMLIMPESNLNNKCAFMMEKLKDCAELHCENGRFFATNTPGFADPRAIRQPGGVATVNQGKYMTRFAGVEYDKAGRWSVHKFFGKIGFLKIYSIYRVCKMNKKAGDTTAWSQQCTFYQKKGKDVNPRKQIVSELQRSIETDLGNSCQVIVAGDFNEDIGDEKCGIHGSLTKIGLLNVFQEKMGDRLPRTYRNGSKCLDHIYTTMKIYESLTSCGIAPFHYLQKSDHRGCYVDIDLKHILDTGDLSIMPASLRRLKMNSVKGIQKYEEQIQDEIVNHKYIKKIDDLKKRFEDTLDSSVLEADLNKLDDEITASMLNAENKCSNVNMSCRLDWSPQLKYVLRNYRWSKNNVKKIKRNGLISSVDDYNFRLKNAYEERRKWKKELKATQLNVSTLREKFLNERATYLAGKKNTVSMDELKMLKHHEKQRKEAGRVKRVIKGKQYSSLTSIEIPALDQYDDEQRHDPNFSHKNIRTIWKKINSTNNGKLVKNWEKIESKEEVERMIIHWQELYQSQAGETPLATDAWEVKFDDPAFREAVLQGRVNPDSFDEPEIFEFIQAMQIQKNVPEIKFEYSFTAFKDMIKK